MRIELTQLQLAERESIGDGGQGTIYEIDPPLAAAIGCTEAMVAKLYERPLPQPALGDFLDRIHWMSSLTAAPRAELQRVAAWPRMAIDDRGALAGILMADQRKRYETQIHLPSGQSESLLMSLEHLLNEDRYLEERFAIACDTRVRAAIGERLAAAVAVLHRHGIVASDISHANVLVSLVEPYAITLIDCDSMTFQGKSTLSLVETPGWEMPPAWGESPTTREADAYKLGLAILRLFARAQGERLLDPVASYVPTPLHDLLRRALGAEPRQRPSAGRWQSALRDVLGTPLATDFPGPPRRGRAGRSPRGVPPPSPMPAPSPLPPGITVAGGTATPTMPGGASPTNTAGGRAAPTVPPGATPIVAATPTGTAGGSPMQAPAVGRPAPVIPPPPLRPTPLPRKRRPRRRAALIALALIVLALSINAIFHSTGSTSPPAIPTPQVDGQGHGSAGSGATATRSHPRADRPRQVARRHTRPRVAKSSPRLAPASSVRRAPSSQSSTHSEGGSSISPARANPTPPSHTPHTQPASPPPSARLEGSPEQPHPSGGGGGGGGGLQGSAQSESGSSGGEGGLSGSAGH